MTTASIFWGFGFVATIWSLHGYTPAEAVVYRFFFSTLFGMVIFAIGNKASSLLDKKDMKKSLPAGLMLGLMQLTQTIGLESTSAGKCAFITSLYVILVPIITSMFFKKLSPFRIYAFAIMALFGTSLLVNSNFENINRGDLWTFICAILAALHIIYIGLIASEVESPFRFNTFQSCWALFTVAPFLLSQKEIHGLKLDIVPLSGLLSLCLGSSLLAFYFQLKAQKFLSNTTATMISLIESPIAATFGFCLLGEVLSGTQVFGIMIILLSSILSVIFDKANKVSKMLT